WNAMRIRLEKRHIQVWVNDTKTVDADLDTARDKFAAVPPLNRRTGRIAFQQNQRTTVEFRDVRIRLLADKSAPSEHGTFVPLFNGKDLSGWFVESTDEKDWRLEAGELVSKGFGPSPPKNFWIHNGYLLSDREYSDFVLRCQFRQ